MIAVRHVLLQEIYEIFLQVANFNIHWHYDEEFSTGNYMDHRSTGAIKVLRRVTSDQQFGAVVRPRNLARELARNRNRNLPQAETRSDAGNQRSFQTMCVTLQPTLLRITQMGEQTTVEANIFELNLANVLEMFPKI